MIPKTRRGDIIPIPLDEEGNYQLRVSVYPSINEIKEFSVSLIWFKAEKQKIEVARIDTENDKLHFHPLWKKKRKPIVFQELRNEDISKLCWESALYLQTNWKKYVEYYQRGEK